MTKGYFDIKTIASFVVLIVLGVSIYLYSHQEKAESLNTMTTLPIVPETTEEEPAIVVGPDLLGKASLSYAGGTDGRNKNIELGVSHIDGTTILPGEEFSFARAIGSVTLEDGYSEERVFLNNEVTKGLGGGLCQVSTILFQSLISAGLPITERHNHTYTVVLYDTGLDATYADPGPDLKFVNDTANPVTIKGRTENLKAIFEIYGVSDGRIASTTEAEITNIVDISPTKYIATTTRDKSEPECINAPQIGYTAEVKYNVLYLTGERKQQVFTSTYKPLQKICYINSGI